MTEKSGSYARGAPRRSEQRSTALKGSTALKAHKFHVGQSVYFTSSSFGRPAAAGTYKVIKLLPSDGDDYQYRIKSPSEAFERVAKESQLDRDR
jgi:hypothetical protein